MKKILFSLLALGMTQALLLPTMVSAAGEPCMPDGHNRCGAAGGCDVGERCTFNTVSFYLCAPDNSCPAGDPADGPLPPDSDGSSEENDTGLNVFEAPNAESFRQLNPLQITESPLAESFVSPAAIVNRILQFLFPIAGLILFAMLVWGGLNILSNPHSSTGLKAGRERITAALVGFFLLFASFWIIQIVEFVFGLSVL